MPKPFGQNIGTFTIRNKGSKYGLQKLSLQGVNNDGVGLHFRAFMISL